MELTTFLILLIIFILAMVIGFSIKDTKMRVSYYAIVALLTLSILCTYTTIVYYIQLRNQPGIPGDMGNKGIQGSKGISGKCTFTDTCKIEDVRNKILNVANEMYGIPNKCLDTPTLKTCSDQNTLEEAIPINKQVDMLEKIAYSTTMAEQDFMNKLQVCLQDSNSCMDPTDF
jgi:hypothetical protein